MRKNVLVALAALALLSLVVFAGCSKSEAKTAAPSAAAAPAPAAPAAEPVAKPASPAYQDGIYFAMDDSFASSGWKETVTLTVSGGKIVDADWNAVNIAGGADKKTYDKAGKYNMVKFGKAQGEWYQQAEKAEAHLLATQDPAAISYKDAEGHTDDIAGVSVHVNAFFELAQKALAAGPVGRGPYADGAYFAIDEAYPNSGWKEYVSLTVLNGRIAGVNWSAVNRNGDDKKAYDKAGKYNMVKFGKAQDEWYVQAEKTENHLIATQDLKAITYKDAEGHTDDIAGVSVHVNSLYALVEKALANGPVALGPFANGGYYATEAEFGSSGWKGFVSLFVSNGNLVNVYWSAVDKDNRDKQTVAKEGGYGMIKASTIGKEWHEQAAAVQSHLLSTQDPKKINYKDEKGHTDDIAGATVHVNDFYALVEQALANGAKKY
ncbi:MAG: hypothetical protein EOM32_10110 [Spirochaetia bacterium]|uniref:hypothetical protein n=1 Tax=Sphaerochaeta sp. TaxID=1972642 RepID=UPI001D2CB4C6|nr:hypothetical protein [Sphaerochaeta sp.]NCC13710.1 hypothetical protein [Spirochaetia bacterium]NCC88755.1 hypothetical protein [Spirochaetia bacterium]